MTHTLNCLGYTNYATFIVLYSEARAFVHRDTYRFALIISDLHADLYH